MWARYHARMTGSPLRETIEARVRDAIPDLRWLALFGSQAQGHARPESDVDVGLFAAGVIPADRLQRLRGDLEAATGRDVHLVDLRAATTVLRSQIVATAEVLYSSGDRDSEEFLDFVFSDYARLNEERADILRDVRARGRIHGR